MEARLIPRNLKPDRVGTNEVWAKLRADPWQPILTILSTVVIVGIALYQGEIASGWGICVLLLLASASGLRMRNPIWSQLGLLGAALLAASFAEKYASMCIALAVIGLISIGIERPIRIVVPVVVLTQATFFGMFTLLNKGSVDSSVFGVIFGTAGAAGLGVAIRSQRQFIAAINERARNAEETRESESRRRVSEERLRIARDLHDTLAHHIAVVSVYTGLARTTMHTSVERAEDALAKAQESTRSVLEELQQIVHILRDPEIHPGSARQPVPGFSAIEDLVSSFEDAGFHLDYRVHGSSRVIPAATGLVAYRVIQEALTNAAKYGNGSADLDVTIGDDSLGIEVKNRISGSEHGRVARDTG